MSTDDSTNIDLFIGQFMADDNQKLPLGVSFAGNYYQRKVRSILSIKSSISIIYGNKKQNVGFNNDVVYIILRQSDHIYNVTVIIGKILKMWLRSKHTKTVLFYNLSIYSLFFYLYYIFLKKTRVVVLLADAGFMSEKSFTSRLIRKSLSYSYGILALREMTELRQFKAKIEIMPGIVMNDLPKINFPKTPNSVLLSGSLGLTTGLLLALEYFSSQKRFKLIITGVPFLMSDTEFKEIIDMYRSESIEFLGSLEYSEYMNILQSVEFSLNLRNPEDIEHNYNFPSKILEYMSYGIIVISSLKYPELPDEHYFNTQYSANGLNDCFKEILGSDLNERETIAKKASDFVRTNFSEEVLNRKICKLFN